MHSILSEDEVVFLVVLWGVAQREKNDPQRENKAAVILSSRENTLIVPIVCRGTTSIHRGCNCTRANSSFLAIRP
jgi:hypothetical protein